MSIVHQKLHLQHHRHTGKLLHHRHTSYRGLAVVLGLASIVIVGLNVMAHVTADSLTVYARNPAPIPTTPAVITSPAEGSVKQAVIVVQGTCPVITPRVVVAILVDGVEEGSAACDSSNTFTVPIVVTQGLHTLVARTYTVTDDSGPDSDPVHIIYIPPSLTVVPANGNIGNQGSGNITPLVVTIDEPFIVFGPGKDAVWLGTITGGNLPYHVRIDWGDGNVGNYTVKTRGQQQFQHHYTKMQSYDLTFTVSDADGRQLERHYAAVTPYVPPVIGNLFGTTPRSPFSGPGMIGLYGAYLLLLAGFGWLWVHAHQFKYAPAHIGKGRPTFTKRYTQSYASSSQKRRKPTGRAR